MVFQQQNQSLTTNIPALVPNNTPVLQLKESFEGFSASLDLTPVKFKLIKEKGWDVKRASLVEKQYKAFLFLMGTKHDHMFVPTLDIDEMWHTHILDTQKYMADCVEYFGEYIHHYPYLGMKDGEDEVRAQKLFAATCAMISDAFDVDIRNLKFTCCGGGGGGGCGGGGASCGGGSSSCGSAPSSCSTAPASTPASCGTMVPVFCGSVGGSDPSPSKDDQPRRKEEPQRRPDRPQEKRRGVIRSILGLSPHADQAKWYASVTPELFAKHQYRPDAAAFDQLCADKKYH